MLDRLTVRGFKSLADVAVDLPRFAVLFGPNATGKSNLLDAVQALSWIAWSPTLSDALRGPFPVRGRSVEAFSFGKGGLPALLRQPSAHFSLEADISTKEARYRYRIRPSMNFRSGELGVSDEYLARLRSTGSVVGTPAIEAADNAIHVRRKGSSSRGRPRKERLGLNHSVLSDRSLSGNGYSWLDHVRDEFASWRTHHFEPRLVMRQDESPMDVTEIGIHGHTLAAFLYKLKATQPESFRAIVRVMRTIVPGVENLDVALDERRGILDLQIRQDGTNYSSRVLSEGTLRLLAMCAIAVNPWAGSLVALEEPENGVHPRRIEFIARLLVSLSEREGRQVIVTTHSPLFVDAVLKMRNEAEVEGVGLFNVRLSEGGTLIEPFDASGPLLQDEEIVRALESPAEDAIFQNLVLRGLVDE